LSLWGRSTLGSAGSFLGLLLLLVFLDLLVELVGEHYRIKGGRFGVRRAI
jgi:hypothetical protein